MRGFHICRPHLFTFPPCPQFIYFFPQTGKLGVFFDPLCADVLCGSPYVYHPLRTPFLLSLIPAALFSRFRSSLPTLLSLSLSLFLPSSSSSFRSFCPWSLSRARGINRTAVPYACHCIQGAGSHGTSPGSARPYLLCTTKMSRTSWQNPVGPQCFGYRCVKTFEG